MPYKRTPKKKGSDGDAADAKEENPDLNPLEAMDRVTFMFKHLSENLENPSLSGAWIKPGTFFW